MILKHSRRSLLRAACHGAGAWLASSTLQPFLPPELRPRARAASDGPTNLLLVYHPNGLEVGWQPHGGVTNFQLGSVLQSLEPHRQQLLITSGWQGGIRNEVQGHPQGMTSMWTGARIAADADFAGHPSIDQLLAARLGSASLFPSLEFGVQTRADGALTNSSAMIYAGAGKPLQAEDDPGRMYDRIFGAATSDAEDVARRRRRRQGVYGMVRAQLTRVRGYYGGPERQLLEQHLSLLGDLEKRLDALSERSGQCAGAAPASALTARQIQQDSKHFPEVARLQRELVALALGCGVTRFASLQYSHSSSNTAIPGVNDRYGIHTVMHSRPREEKVAINRWFVDELARLLDTLSARKLADGRSLLDDTLVVWGTEMAVGNHLNGPLPIVLAGGGGQFELGRWLALEGNPRHTRLLVSLLHAFGVRDVNAVGDFVSPSDTGPLESLWG